MKRSMAVAACLLAVSFLGASPAFADGLTYAHSNIVQVTNSNSAAPAVRTASAVAFDGDNAAVTDTNLAYATGSNCTGCRTVAVAVQVVVVEGTPSNYQPQNAAVAVNDHCTSCQTFAYAHQYVIQVTQEPNGENAESASSALWRIQSQISQVAHSNVDFATMSSQLDQLSLQFYNTVYQALQNQNENGAKKSEVREVKGQN